MKRWTLPLTVAVSLGVAAATLAQGSPASADATYAPLDQAGPALSVPVATLRAALSCHGDPHAGGEPVLLNPATTATPDQNYSWNYERAFTAQGRYWCALTMPFHTTGDIQTAGEYLVFGIRAMHAATGRRIGILGHSQGAMSMRWALRFWPDTRAMVDDVIGFAGTNHGSTLFGQQCLTGLTSCPPAMWQQRAGSTFMKALNSGAETFAGISYTEVFSHTDEVVQPNLDSTGTSSLHTGAGQITNVATQDICPLDVYEHVMIGTIDATAYALAMDALDHAGPADPARIDRSVCGQLYLPYVDPTSVPMYLTVLGMLPALVGAELPDFTTLGSPLLSQEPALRPYVFPRPMTSSPPKGQTGAPQLHRHKHHKRHHHKHPHHHH